MHKYQVTRGTVVKEVEAANKSAALRRFEAENPVDPNTVVPTVKLVEELAEPVKMRYSVKWGTLEREVIATNETDAWSQFVGEKTDTDEYKHPNAHARIITELGPAEEPVKAKDAKSPVDSLHAHEATDSVSRMHSVDKLKEIVAMDQRATVVAAAKKRLSELGG